MKITKIFRTETSHIVRNCTSKRCSHSIHGHSYVFEVELKSNTLDNAQMVCDFGLLKGPVKEYIDGLDHCHLVCTKDSTEYVEFFQKMNDRYINIPFNPSAEMMALWMCKIINDIISKIQWNNGEGYIKCSSVTVWETTTGRATATEDDVKVLWKDEYDKIFYSPGVIEDWSAELYDALFNDTTIANPFIKQQIEL